MSQRKGQPVFGKTHWFCTTHGGLGIRPISFPGWAFLILWLAAILIPSLLFVWISKSIEALIWASFSSWLLIRESRALVREKRREDVFVIGEENDVTKVATNKYDLELRR